MKKHLFTFYCLIIINTVIYTQPVDTFKIEIKAKDKITWTLKETSITTGVLIIDNQSDYEAEIKINDKTLSIVKSKNRDTLPLGQGRSSNYKILGKDELFLPKQPGSGQLTCHIDGKEVEVSPGNANPPTQNNNSTADKPEMRKKSWRFIPSPSEEYSFHLLSISSSGCDGVPPKSVDYDIVYNIQEGRYCYFKDGNPVDTKGDSPKNYFRPREGKDLYFRVAGYSPYSDSLSVTVGFENRNDELEGSVLSQLMDGLNPASLPKSLPATDNTGTNGTPVADPHSTPATTTPDKTTQTISMTIEFRDEMRRFYQQKKDNNENSLSFLKQCVEHIQTQVRTYFNCPDAQPSTVLLYGRAMLDTVITDEKKRATTNLILQEGVQFYKHIITHQIQHFPDRVQIKNADITTISFQRYRDGRLQHSPEPFDLYNTGGFKIDFSTGLVGHFLHEHRFTTDPDTVKVRTINQGPPPDTMTTDLIKGRIIREHSSSFGVDAGVFAHFYSRNKNYRRVNYSGTLGIVPSKQADQLRIRYMAGGSVLFGSEQRLVLTAGVITGKVARLAEGLKYGDKGTLIETPQGQQVNVLTRDLYRAHIFVAATFNFASVSPQKK